MTRAVQFCTGDIFIPPSLRTLQSAGCFAKERSRIKVFTGHRWSGKRGGQVTEDIRDTSTCPYQRPDGIAAAEWRVEAGCRLSAVPAAGPPAALTSPPGRRARTSPSV